jgi:hypothetical protein
LLLRGRHNNKAYNHHPAAVRNRSRMEEHVSVQDAVRALCNVQRASVKSAFVTGVGGCREEAEANMRAVGTTWEWQVT